MSTHSFPPGEAAVMRWLDLCSRARGYLRAQSRAAVEAEKHLDAFYQRAWRDAAARLDAVVEPLGCGVLEISKGRFRTRVHRNSSAIDDLSTHCILRTRPVVHRLLAAAGLPVARSLSFSLAELDQARAFLEAVGRQCVVKPASDSGGGQGVTTGVETPRQLSRAAWVAGRGGREALIEEEVAGDNYRLLFLDGKLLDAVCRTPPTATGDGKSSVEALVRAENSLRLREGQERSHALLSFDLDMENTLARQGLSLASVPRAGEVIQLKTASNENNVLDNEAVMSRVSPEVVATCAEAARISGARLAGVDILTPDPAMPLRRVGGVILEVNSPPGYYWHYHRKGEPVPVALYVLRALLGGPGAQPLEIERRRGKSWIEREEAAAAI